MFVVVNISGVHVCGHMYIRGGCLWFKKYPGCMVMVVNISELHVCGLKHIRDTCLWF